MNPLTNVRNLNKFNERDLQLQVAGQKSSWHDDYKESAWIFFGGVDYGLTEGDLVCIFSQYGEIVNVNLVRDKTSGKSKGFGFVCYEDQRSTVLAVDNFNGAKIVGRTLRVDHVKNYRPPKENESEQDVLKMALQADGCAPAVDMTKSQKRADALRRENEARKERDRQEREGGAVDSDGDVIVGKAAVKYDSDGDIDITASRVKPEPQKLLEMKRELQAIKSEPRIRSERRHSPPRAEKRSRDHRKRSRSSSSSSDDRRHPHKHSRSHHKASHHRRH